MGYKNNISDKREITVDEALIVNYLKGHTSSEETALVQAWMTESEENRLEVRQIAELYATKRAYDRIEARNTEQAYQKVISHINHKQTPRRYTLGWTVAAAFIGAVLLSSLYIFLTQPDQHLQENSILVEANPGVRTNVNLPDGTVVQLNSGSKLIYPESFKGKFRTVTVEGEAFFQVKRDEKKPFIVETSDKRASVQVLGTAFNVQSFKGETEFVTTLVNGSVLVNLNCDNGKKLSRQLVPSEKVIFDKNSAQISIEKVNANDEIAWTKGILVFKNCEMSQVFKTLSHSYNVDFEILNPTIKKHHFTGTFNNKQLTHILNYIKISSDIKYTIKYSQSDDSVNVQQTKIIIN